ncbi:hypothetical protein LOK49_LG10G02669 [Camellia lanceoleosa]|uniref:Uncharacterized protein n=1 Tax=Camellia lanceoleosa TaxID=1840588 RepID=A0ACC0G9Q1_9ERIC|nr:hypothetical protein LOK49_LG10G02669 [Camellia lanceoleosa]
MLTSGKTSCLCIGCNIPPLEDEEDKFNRTEKRRLLSINPRRGGNISSSSRYPLSTLIYIAAGDSL